MGITFVSKPESEPIKEPEEVKEPEISEVETKIEVEVDDPRTHPYDGYEKS